MVLKRCGRADEVAVAIVVPCSKRASFVNEQESARGFELGRHGRQVSSTSDPLRHPGRRRGTAPIAWTISAAISRGGRSAPASTVGTRVQRPSSPSAAIAS